MISYEDFEKVDVRNGTVIDVYPNLKSKKKAYVLKIDFGDLGIKTSSSQLTELYNEKDLIGKSVICVVNFPPKKIANVISEVLVLGVDSKDGIVLLTTDIKCENGKRIY